MERSRSQLDVLFMVNAIEQYASVLAIVLRRTAALETNKANTLLMSTRNFSL